MKGNVERVKDAAVVAVLAFEAVLIIVAILLAIRTLLPLVLIVEALK